MDRYQPMTPSADTPNPLRPYYRPPSIGTPHERAFPSAAPPLKPSNSSVSFGSSARDILSDLNYNEMLGDSSPGMAASIKSLLDQALWKYTSVFMAQPFEVAKLILQIRLSETIASRNSKDKQTRPTPAKTRQRTYESYEDYDDEDDDDPQYFTASTPDQRGSLHISQSTRRRELHEDQEEDVEEDEGMAPLNYHHLDIKKPDSLMEVISLLWNREGAWGIWKGTNSTFVYSLLFKTLETWTRSILAATLNLPDPGLSGAVGNVGGLDIIDSPSPMLSLSVAIAASGLAGLALAPLDTVRTRIILTSSASPSRSIIGSLRDLGSWLCPPLLVLPTLIHSALPTLVSTTTPLFLRSYLRIDPLITPNAYSICTFLSSTAELFARLPFETVLRRGQMHEVLHRHQQKQASAASHHRQRSRSSRSRGRSVPMYKDAQDLEPIETVVEVGPYYGILPTMWHIVCEEGESLSVTGASTKGAPGTAAHRPVFAQRRGQGVHGLWRGWRLGWWGLVGVWGAAAMGGAAGSSAEF